jgi:sporulation integral membrane protein YlbJ
MQVANIISAQTKPKKRILSKVGIVLFLALILCFPASSYNGAKKGLLLWFNTVLPTLLPFIIISNLIIRLQITKPLSKLLHPIFHALFGVSKGGCYPILMGFLSGIPVGAKSIADLVENGTIKKEEGQYLLSFCNNASPMFIMSFIAIASLKQPNIRLHLLLIIYISAILSAILYFRFMPKQKHELNQILTATEYSNTLNETRFDITLLDNSIMDAFEVITKVGGYIILFSIPAQIILNIGNKDNIIKLIIIGICEITTGINQISLTNLDLSIKIVLITMLTAFGGLSGLAQTKSVISNTRLRLSTYFFVKVINMLIAFAISILYIKLLLP